MNFAHFSHIWGKPGITPYQRYEAGVAVDAFLKGRVIAGELKLVFPFELQRDLVQRPGRGSAQ